MGTPECVATVYKNPHPVKITLQFSSRALAVLASALIEVPDPASAFSCQHA